MVQHDMALKLSWELVALSDRGVSEGPERLALEIAYGVALQVGDQSELFSAFLSSIIGQVSDPEMQRLLRHWERKALRG